MRGTRVVQFDRRKNEIIDEAGVIARFGVPPSSIADYLALVGDAADGFPGLPGWGAKSASSVLARYGNIEAIPTSAADWNIAALRGAEKLAETLQSNLDLALLFRRVATIETNIDVGSVDDWRWQGVRAEFAAIAMELGAAQLIERADKLSAKLAT